MILRTTSIFLLLLCLGWGSLSAQTNWKDLKKEAEAAAADRDFALAGIRYGQAFELKRSQLDLAYLAGDYFLKARDYSQALKYLVIAKAEDKKEYELVGLKYALALKQTGEYKQAESAFRQFIGQYDGPQADYWKERASHEIDGCQFGIKAAEQAKELPLQLLSSQINGEKNEFAPIWLNGQLYFSSSRDRKTVLYSSKKTGDIDSWSKAAPFAGNAKINGDFAGGSFSANGRRFYFSMKNKEGKYAIYLLVQESGRWSNPIPLPIYINGSNYNSSYPFVVEQDGKEILYFASDRPGSKGGYDIWRSIRQAESKSFNFSLPQNLGPNINTFADELSPYYSEKDQALYFSSNGHLSAGGLDLFKAQSTGKGWELAQNLGFPINSPADELYYTEGAKGSFFVSNRRIEGQTAPANENIYYLGAAKNIELKVEGIIYAENDPKKTPIEGVQLQLFEQTAGNEELVYSAKLTAQGYSISLDANKRYLVLLTAEGYQTASFELATLDIKRSETQNNPIALRPAEVVAQNPPKEFKSPFFAIVPQEYTGEEKAFKLPNRAEDPQTGKAYPAGSTEAELYERVAKIAARSPSNKVYWAKNNLLPLMEEEEPIVANTPPKEEPKEETPRSNKKLGKGLHKHYDESQEDAAEEGVSYVIQVSAVRRYKSAKYEELQEGPLGDYALSFETIELNITRVLVVPPGRNIDGSIGFKKKTEALNILYHIINSTQFTKAFVVEYKDGERVGKGFRGLSQDDEI